MTLHEQNRSGDGRIPLHGSYAVRSRNHRCGLITLFDVDTEKLVEGTLGETPLSVLLNDLAQQQRTGRLKIDADAEFWLHDGRTYLAAAASSPELSKVLATEGETPESQTRQKRLLHEYNLNSLFELLVPSQATYRFEPDAVHPIGHRHSEDTAEMLQKAADRIEIWRRIAARIPSTAAVFTLRPALPPEVDERVVAAEEWRFLARLNGTNTVADIINQTGESPFRVCSSLYRLLLEDLIEQSPAANSPTV